MKSAAKVNPARLVVADGPEHELEPHETCCPWKDFLVIKDRLGVEEWTELLDRMHRNIAMGVLNYEDTKVELGGQTVEIVRAKDPTSGTAVDALAFPKTHVVADLSPIVRHLAVREVPEIDLGTPPFPTRLLTKA